MSSSRRTQKSQDDYRAAVELAPKSGSVPFCQLRPMDTNKCELFMIPQRKAGNVIQPMQFTHIRFPKADSAIVPQTEKCILYPSAMHEGACSPRTNYLPLKVPKRRTTDRTSSDATPLIPFTPAPSLFSLRFSDRYNPNISG